MLNAHGNDEPQGAGSNAGIPAFGSYAHNEMAGIASCHERSNSECVSLVVKTNDMMRRKRGEPTVGACG